jgi:hypothetical protein
VIRALHYHDRGQNDLFACLQGTARVVLLDREVGETFTVDIGDENPVGVWIPGRHAHGFEALTDLLFCYHVTEEYDPADPDEHEIPWDDPRVKHLWSTQSPILSSRDKGAGVLVTGAGGQLDGAPGGVLGDDVSAVGHADWDVSVPPPDYLGPFDVLHAAREDVDGAENDPQGLGQCRRDDHAAELGPLVYYSTDCVFDGQRCPMWIRTRQTCSGVWPPKAFGEAAAGDQA